MMTTKTRKLIMPKLKVTFSEIIEALSLLTKAMLLF